MSYKEAVGLVHVCALVLALCVAIHVVVADSYMANCHKLGSYILNKALKLLNKTKVTESMLLLTNVKYILVEGTSLACLEMEFEKAGFVELLNLVNVHSPFYSTPWVFMYDNNTKRAVYLELNTQQVLKFLKTGHAEEIFSKVRVFTFNISKIITEGRTCPSKLWAWLESSTSSSSAFSILTITAVWSRGAPPDLLLAAELHNHVCPGLMSGIMILRYLEKTLEEKFRAGTRIFIVAVPPWCKDDVYVQLLDATPGKRRIIVKFLTREEEEKLRKIFGADMAGIVIILTGSSGTGYVVAFNWTKVWKMLGISPQLLHGSTWWWSRLVADLLLLRYLDKPEKFVSIVKTFPVKTGRYRYPDIYYRLGLAEEDPYATLGLIKRPETTHYMTTRVSGMVPYIILTAVISALVAASVTYVIVKRRRS